MIEQTNRRLSDNVVSARWRLNLGTKSGNPPVLQEARVMVEEGLLIAISEIKPTKPGDPTKYTTQRYRLQGPPACADKRDKEVKYRPEGEPEVWDELRVRILVGATREAFRVAIRTEDSYVVAYLAEPETMDGALKIAVIHRSIFDLVDGAAERFKADVAEYSRLLLAEATGIPATSISTQEQTPRADA